MTGSHFARLRCRSPIVAVIIGIFWLGSVIAVQLGRAPYIDEGFYSISARNWVLHGTLDSREIESSGFVEIAYDSPLPGIGRHAYWQMPLFSVVAAGFFRVLGIALLPFRMVSLLFAIAGLALWFRLIRLWSGRTEVAWAAVLFIAFDWTYLSAGALARPDMMGHTLGLLALYIHERYFRTAPARSCAAAALCLCAALFTHPNAAAVWGVLYLVRLIAEWKRWSAAQFAALAVACLVAGGCFAVWATRDWSAFQAQLTANSHFRVVQLSLALPLQELARYRALYGIPASSTGPLLAAKLYSVLPWVVALPWLALRRGAARMPGLRRCVLMAVTAFTVLSLVDATKFPHYALHTVPWLAALAAFGLAAALDKGISRPLLLGMTAAYLLGAGMLAYGVGWRNLSARQGTPAVASLKALHRMNEAVFAPPEFRLSYDGPMIYDIRLGYRSGRRPGAIALRREDIEEDIAWARRRDPGLAAYYSTLLKACRLKYENEKYLVYDCGAPVSQADAGMRPGRPSDTLVTFGVTSPR